MTPENELQRAMNERVAGVRAAGDLPEIQRRATRRAGGRRAMGISLVAILVLGAGATGFAFGRNATSDSASNASPDVGDVAEPPATEPPASEETPNDAVDVPATVAPALPMTTDGAFEYAADDATRGMMGYGWGSYYYDEPSVLLTSRTTDAGYRVRVSRSPDSATFYYGGGYSPTSFWQPAAWCFPSGELRIAVAGPSVIDVSGGSWFTEPYEGLAVTMVQMGVSDGQPVFVVVAQVAADVIDVTVSADGVSDTTTPENGVVALLIPGTHDDGSVSVSINRATGAEVVTTADLVGAQATDYQKYCNPPPPPLPPAGEQPADVALATEAIHAAVAAVFSPGDDLDARVAAIDDPTGLAEAFAAAVDGPFAEAVASAQHTVTEVVFTSPTEAWFRYDISTSISSFTGRFGRAVQVDGVWKVTRATVCQDLSLASTNCSPYSEPVTVPGTENWYDQFYDSEDQGR